MVIDKVAAKRSRSHTRYYDKDGKLLPGVTTILNILNKPALGPWHNRMGLEGIDTAKYVDALALCGTISHDMICHHNRGIEFDGSIYPDELVDKAENSFLSYLAWEKQHKIEPILCEAPLVSNLHGYGGTVDMLALVDGVSTIVDYKTGKAIYPEHLYQVAAYRQLLEENGHFVANVRILQIGRDETEGFSEKVLDGTTREWMIFQHCLLIYQLQKKGKEK